MRLTATRGTEFEQTLRELYEQDLRNKEEAIKAITEYYGVKPVRFMTHWALGFTRIFSPLDISPEYMPETLKKGVKEIDGVVLTVNRRTKVGREFLREWETRDCAKGLSGESLEQFGIHTLDTVTLKYGCWRVCKTDNGLYCLEIGEFALRKLTDEAKEMMTIGI